MALTGSYGLVVLDLLMPGTSGTSVLEQTMARRPHQPVLILSALSDIETKVRCFNLGASDYLTKPFALVELLARIRAQLRGSGAPSELRMNAGAIMLDIQRRLADSGEGPVPLSGRELLLLQHLMTHEGEVCTREEILADVWGCSFDTGTNVVDVYIGRLRSKLGSLIIETVRNVGYCLSV
jgi:DNA-binding response OmpR family regulator